MSLFENYCNYALLNDEIEFSRYYELREDEEGTQYMCDMFERTIEHICRKLTLRHI